MGRRSYSIALVRGDGIGPEIVKSTLQVLDAVSIRRNFRLEFKEISGGDSALKLYGDAFPKQSIETFLDCDSCLKGPVGETVMDLNTKLRFGFDLYANIRPAKSYPGICPPALKPDIDMIVIRENSEGFYRAIEQEVIPGVWTSAGVFTENGARRIADVAFQYAKKRQRREGKELKVTLATKSNIFQKTHGMYARIFQKTSENYPEIKFEHLYADALCARMVLEPQKFDVIVSENLIADLLSDLAGQVAGGLGMTPSTNINFETKRGYFEPTHGCAPDIAGRGLANPIGQIRSGSMMLEFLGTTHKDPNLIASSRLISNAIENLLNSGNASILPRELGGQADCAIVTEYIKSYVEQN